jgi:hypothetical protein
MVGPRPPQRRAVHGRPRHRDRERRVAFDPGRPRVLAGEPPVGDQRLRPRLRRLPAARWPGRRHARPSPGVHGRPRSLHAGLAARWLRLERGIADRRSRCAGPRRGDHLAGRALDPDDDVPRGQGAQRRARRLGRRRRLRRRSRRASRRRLHRRPQLGVDLLHQRAGRRNRPRGDEDAARREPRRTGEELRRPRRRARHLGPVDRRLRDHTGNELRRSRSSARSSTRRRGRPTR